MAKPSETVHVCRNSLKWSCECNFCVFECCLLVVRKWFGSGSEWFGVVPEWFGSGSEVVRSGSE
eukprot:1689647-Alexandrium_andersonii.AAC.1